jgi:hypothetical protein
MYFNAMDPEVPEDGEALFVFDCGPPSTRRRPGSWVCALDLTHFELIFPEDCERPTYIDDPTLRMSPPGGWPGPSEERIDRVTVLLAALAAVPVLLLVLVVGLFVLATSLVLSAGSTAKEHTLRALRSVFKT